MVVLIIIQSLIIICQHFIIRDLKEQISSWSMTTNALYADAQKRWNKDK